MNHIKSSILTFFAWFKSSIISFIAWVKSKIFFVFQSFSQTDFGKGFKKAYNIPMLPPKIKEFTMHPSIRIIRFLGGLSILFLLGKSHIDYPYYFTFFFMFFAFIFWIYHCYLFFHRTKHFIAVLKSDKLEVRNSPLNRFAYLSAKAIWCLKFGCDTAQPVGVSLGLMLGADEILKAANVEPVFIPMLGGILKTVLPESASRDTVKLIQQSIDAHNSNRAEGFDFDTLRDAFKTMLVEDGLTEKEHAEFQGLIDDNIRELESKNSKLKEEIGKLLDKNKK